MLPRALIAICLLIPAIIPAFARSISDPDTALARRFTETVHPFIETYCLKCHGKEEPEADLDLSAFSNYQAVIDGYAQWELALEKLEAAEMPPKKAKKHPTQELRREIIDWIAAVRKNEAHKNAGDPGPVLPRRLSNAEYDYTIHDLTGVDIRPTREFPVDPANQAGFDNSGESLAMSPALVKKYLQAARTVAEHLVLKPDGFEFAPHPVVADTDRDKYAVLRIVDFYKRQPTNYADYFEAAWRFQHRALLGKPAASLAEIAAEMKISPKYLTLIWSTLTDAKDEAGPIAKLRTMWRALPASPEAEVKRVRRGCEEMRDFVVALREKIVPEVKNLTAPKIQNGSQTLVLWKNRQMAANRRRYDPQALQVEGAIEDSNAADSKNATTDPNLPKPAKEGADASAAKQPPRVQRPSGIPEIVQKGGVFLSPSVTTTESSATFKMAAAKKRGSDPGLIVPADLAARALHEAAFARFADVFPDAFYITERARVYMDATKEQQNAGRLLSAGLHSMTGFFRDDGPLYDLILHERGRRELDRLWAEFDFSAGVPMRMHTSFVWFERTDSSFMRDLEFDPYRPEDRSVTSQKKIRELAELYLAKAERNGASELVQEAIREHFKIVAANIQRVEAARIAAEPRHLEALEKFAERAYRRPLTTEDRKGLRAFYRESRRQNGVDHEEAMRDAICRVLLSPYFAFRIDLVDGVESRKLSTNGKRRGPRAEDIAVPRPGISPLSSYSLASRLSYFLWSSAPDQELLDGAAAGDLQKPEVLAAQAARMLKDPRITRLAREFGGHWLDFRRFEEHNSVDRERYPAFDNDLRKAMFEEPIRFFVDLIQRDRSVLDCLYADHTFVNAPLAKHYGMSAAETSADRWIRIDHARQFERGGLLPMAVFLTANSPGLRTSPVKRGYWVVRRVLGERIPPPPAVVPDLPNDEAHFGDLTLREVLAKHREDPSCASCHARFDSFGLVFEGYGAVGERRKKDFGGRPVQTRAPFPGGSERTGLEGLIDYVREHREEDFLNNLCRKLLTYGLGRTLLPSDDFLINEMRTKLAANGYRFATLVESIVTSPQFRTKRSIDREKNLKHALR